MNLVRAEGGLEGGAEGRVSRDGESAADVDGRLLHGELAQGGTQENHAAMIA
jgi:hypothetical protein